MNAELPTCPAGGNCPHRGLCDTRRLCSRMHVAPIDLLDADAEPAVHFVGFTGEEWHSAVAAFGPPDFIHRVWDERARQEVAPADTVVFAQYQDQPPTAF